MCHILVLTINSSHLSANEIADKDFRPMAFPHMISSWSNVHACFLASVAHVFNPRV